MIADKSITGECRLSWACIIMLRSFANSRFADQLTIGLCCGATAQEVEAVRWTDIDLYEGLITLGDQTPMRRSVALPQFAAGQLESRRAREYPSRPTDLLFDPRIDGPVRVHWSSLFHLWGEAFQAAVVDLPPPVSTPPFEALREFTILTLLDFGIDRQTVASWAGINHPFSEGME